MRRITVFAGVLAAASMAGGLLAGPASADHTTAKCAEQASYTDFQKCMKDATATADKARAAAAKKEADDKRECEDNGGSWDGSPAYCDIGE